MYLHLSVAVINPLLTRTYKHLYRNIFREEVGKDGIGLYESKDHIAMKLKRKRHVVEQK